MLGVTLFEYRNKPNNLNLQESIALYICSSGVFVNSLMTNKYKHICSDGERTRVTIDIIRGTVGWERTHPTYMPIGTLLIPEKMRQKQFYPHIEFNPNFDGLVTVL
jgi:hypothetical protein